MHLSNNYFHLLGLDIRHYLFFLRRAEEIQIFKSYKKERKERKEKEKEKYHNNKHHPLNIHNYIHN